METAKLVEGDLKVRRNRDKTILDTRYEEMDRKEFDAWLKKVSYKLLWFSYRDLIDIAAKYTAVHGQEKEYPQKLVEALDITCKIEMAKKKKRKKNAEKLHQKFQGKFQDFPPPPNLREEDCWEEYNRSLNY